MIECVMLADDDFVCLKATGHAGYAEEGKDIVCAAASTLCNTLVEFLRQKGVGFEHQLGKGDIEIKFKADECDKGIWDVVLFVATGFHILWCTYPKYIDFKKNF